PVPPVPPVLPDPDGPPQPPAPPVHPPAMPAAPARTMLTLAKTSSPRVVKSGQTISYTLRVANAGEATALRVQVCDTPPSGVVVPSAPGFHRSDGSICTTIPHLLIGADRTFQLKAAARPGVLGRLVNHATASATNAPAVHSSAHNLVVKPPRAPQPTVTG